MENKTRLHRGELAILIDQFCRGEGATMEDGENMLIGAQMLIELAERRGIEVHRILKDACEFKPGFNWLQDY